jgi:hypothetical protein
MEERKYKLIKKYPSSPKLGAIVEKKGNSIYFPETKETWSSSNPNYFDVMVTNQPEFWEKVVEPDYEVLSFRWIDRGGTTPIYTLKNDKYCFDWAIPTANKYSLEQMLSELNSHYIIYSVKRLSDGEIFTVGDNTTTGIIKEFIFQGDCIGMVTGEHTSWVGIKVWRKVKQPLFTTEDGVDIFEGDTAIPLDPVSFKIYAKTPYTTGESTKYGIYKYFSTKQKAEEYILMSKPCLSINDVLSVGQRVIADEGKLKQIVKSRL